MDGQSATRHGIVSSFINSIENTDIFHQTFGGKEGKHLCSPCAPLPPVSSYGDVYQSKSIVLFYINSQRRIFLVSKRSLGNQVYRVLWSSNWSLNIQYKRAKCLIIGTTVLHVSNRIIIFHGSHNLKWSSERHKETRQTLKTETYSNTKFSGGT